LLDSTGPASKCRKVDRKTKSNGRAKGVWAAGERRGKRRGRE